MIQFCNLQDLEAQLEAEGLSGQQAGEFISSLGRSIQAYPDAGLTEFHKFCNILHVQGKEVRSQVGFCLQTSL